MVPALYLVYGRGFEFSLRKEFFNPIESPDGLWSPNMFLFKGNHGSFPEVNGPVCDTHQSPPSSVEDTNKCSYNTPPPPHYLHSWRGPRQRYLVTFSFACLLQQTISYSFPDVETPGNDATSYFCIDLVYHTEVFTR